MSSPCSPSELRASGFNLSQSQSVCLTSCSERQITQNVSRVFSRASKRNNTLGSQTSTFSLGTSPSMSKFSLASHKMKCAVPGHQGKSIEYICLLGTCKLSSRAACVMCYKSSHAQHLSHLVSVKELLSVNDQDEAVLGDQPSFPPEKIGKQVKAYLDKENSFVSSVYADTERIFSSFTRDVIEKIEAVKKAVIGDINAHYLRGQGRMKVVYLAQLKQLYDGAYDKSNIAEAVSKYFQREFSVDTMNTAITQSILNPETIQTKVRLSEYFMNRCDKNNFGIEVNLNKQELAKMQRDILSQIERLRSTLSEAKLQQTEDNKQMQVRMLTEGNSEGEGDVQRQKKFEELLEFMQRSTESEKEEITYRRERYADTSLYVGFQLAQMRHLIGTRYYSDGNIYTGQWNRGDKHGQGKMQFRQGTVYAGEWVDDKKHGVGIETYPNGAKYEGKFEQGVKHGKGRYIETSGKVYAGSYVKDKRSGEGIFYYKDGTCEQVYYIDSQKVSEEDYDKHLAGEENQVITMQKVRSSGRLRSALSHSSFQSSFGEVRGVGDKILM